MRCDLHTHSVYSDGTSTPAEIISAAKALNIIVALTDHNTVSGLPEFQSEAKKQGVTAVSGVELSTALGEIELHLLGLFIPEENYEKVEKLAKEFHVLKEISNMEMVERLNLAGYNIDYAAVKRRNIKGNANRAHVAAELLKMGYVSSIDEAFKNILDDRHGFYVPPARLDTLDAIRFLREINALPILAHPLKDLSEHELIEKLPQMIDAGLVGIETRHSSYTQEKINISKEIANEFDILESGGSDFHGTNKPDIQLATGKGNLDIQKDIYDKLLKLHNSLY